MTARKLLTNKFIHGLLAAFFVGLMFYRVIYSCDIVPYGDNNRILFDMKRQYVDFYSYYKTIVSGQNNILYSLELSLGAGAVSFFTYYLSSPFMLIVLFFENAHLPEAVNVMVGIKLVLSAYCCDLFLQHYLESDKKFDNHRITFVFSVCYAFSSYMLSNSTNPMWMDVFMMMPIVIWMLDRLIKDDKKAGYIISLAYIIYCNYYIAFMVCIFIVMWTLFRLFSAKKPAKKEIITTLVKVLYCSVLGAMLDSWFLFTTVSELFNSPKDITQLGLETTAERYSLTEIYSKIFTLTYNKLQTYFGTPLMYAGVVVVLLTLLYFMNSKINLREKICMAVMLLIFVISYQVDVINLIWHGGMEPSGYPFRETFLYVFLILICGCSCLNTFGEGINIVKIAAAGIVTMGFFLYITTKKYDFADSRMIKINCLLIIGYTVLLAVMRIKNKKNLFAIAGVLLICIATVTELTCNAIVLYRIQGTWHRDDNSYFVKMVEDTTPAVEAAKEDKSFYRMENATPRESNDSMMYDYHCVTHYSSAGTLTTRHVLTNMGYGDNGLFTNYGHNNTCLADSILGVKYLLTSAEVEHRDYRPIYEGEVSTYLNPYAMSVANLARATDAPMEGNPFEVQEKLLEIVLGKECEVFVPAKVELIQEQEEDREITVYTVTANCDGNIYFYIDGIENSQPEMELFMGEESLGEYGDGASLQILNLGFHEKGEAIELSSVVPVGQETEGNVLFMTEDMSKIAEYTDEARELAATIGEISSSHLVITLPDGYEQQNCPGVMLTIPYHPGWKIKGSNVQPTACADYLMYLPIEAFDGGKAEISYVPTGWYAGISVSVVALIVTIIVNLGIVKKSKQNESK